MIFVAKIFCKRFFIRACGECFEKYLCKMLLHKIFVFLDFRDFAKISKTI